MAVSTSNSTAFEARPAGGSRLELVGELDLATVSILREAFERMAPEEQVTLDLSQLGFIDSCGLREISTYSRSLNGNGPLILENVPDRVTSVFKIVAFDELPSIQLS